MVLCIKACGHVVGRESQIPYGSRMRGMPYAQHLLLEAGGDMAYTQHLLLEAEGEVHYKPALADNSEGGCVC